MAWSFSKSKQFARCQRQWFLKNHVANARARKEPIRREAFLLSKLDSVFAWRGKLVDKVVTDYIITPLHFGSSPNPQYVLLKAQELFNRQLDFAKLSRLREPGMTVTKAGDEFAALRDIEYEGEVDDRVISQAWDDVERALLNLLEMKEFLNRLRQATTLIAQRILPFKLESFNQEFINVIAVPDLIAFYESAPPLIVDWKVHTFGRIDYRLQLASYALALTRCDRHKDFPPSLSSYPPTEIDLLEVQLLTKRHRTYKLDEQDIHELEAYIAETEALMKLAVDGVEEMSLTPFDFPTTQYPETCQRCSFRKLCWEKNKWEKAPQPELKQISLFSRT